MRRGDGSSPEGLETFDFVLLVTSLVRVTPCSFCEDVPVGWDGCGLVGDLYRNSPHVPYMV
jgi:hypothetical protein